MIDKNMFARDVSVGGLHARAEDDVDGRRDCGHQAQRGALRTLWAYVTGGTVGRNVV